MAHPHVDRSAPSPEERPQLVDDIRDSLAREAPESVPILESHARELERRVAAFRQDGQPGRPWVEALDEVEAGLKRRGG